MLLFGEGDDEGIRTGGIGDRVRVRGSVEPAEPGDAVAYLVFAREPVEVVTRASGALGVAAQMRERFAALAAKLPGSGAALLPGLAIGDTSRESPEKSTQPSRRFLNSGVKVRSMARLAFEASSPDSVAPKPSVF